MKMIFNSWFLSLICLVMLLGSIASCKKDDNVDTGKVELLSFGPAGVKHGQDISFIGKNLDKVTAIEFMGASVPGSAFKTHTSELIILTVPQEAERGVVTLKTGSDDIISKAMIDFDVPFSITSVSGTARPGGTITVKGQFLNWITSVEFAEGVSDTNFVSKSLTELIVKVPMEAQTGSVIFWGAGTEPISVETEAALIVTLPSITSLSPVSVMPETNLTITGADLDLTSQVILPGVTNPITQFVSKSATEIVVKLPKEARMGKVILKAYSGVRVESVADLVVTLPSITIFSPGVVARESNLTITGTHLDLAVGVIFKGVANPITQFVSRSATEIVVKVPKEANRGVIAVKAISGVIIESTKAMAIEGDVLPLDPLKYAFYADSYQNGWENWGWGNTNDPGSTDFVRDGEKSLKATFTNSWGGIKFANREVSTAGYTELTFAIYGGASTEGKKVKVQPNGGSAYEAVIQEGKWVEVKIKLADIGSPSKITELLIQEMGWTGTIYIDHVGLR